MRLDAHGLFTPLRTICWNLRAGLVLVIVVLLSSPSVFGQGIVTGMISGTVMDAQGAVVAGATVQSTHVATAAKFSDKSDAQGYYELKGLPIGLYNLTIEASGFRKLQLSNVVVEAGKSTALGAHTLDVGATSELITVEAPMPLVESTSSQIGGTFDTTVVEALPNAGAGFDNLALFMPRGASNGSMNVRHPNRASSPNHCLCGS